MFIFLFNFNIKKKLNKMKLYYIKMSSIGLIPVCPDDYACSFTRESLLSKLRLAMIRGSQNGLVIEGDIIHNNENKYYTITDGSINYYHQIDSDNSFESCPLDNIGFIELVSIYYDASSQDLLPDDSLEVSDDESM